MFPPIPLTVGEVVIIALVLSAIFVVVNRSR